MNYKGLLFTLSFLLCLTTTYAQLQLSAAGGSGDPGTSFQTDIVVSNFDDLVSAQWTIVWDPTVLRFEESTNIITTLPDFSSGAIGDFAANTDAGRITVSWNESSFTPVSLPDNSVLFSIEFTAIGAPCDTTSIAFANAPLSIEVIDENEDEVDVDISNGPFMIPGTDCENTGGGDLGFSIDPINAGAGDEVCVPIVVTGFECINTIQFSITFDEDVLEYDRLGEVNLAGFGSANLGTLNADNGVLTVVWSDSGTDGETLPDGSTIFELCFNVIGAEGSTGMIEFGGAPLGIDITNKDGETVPATFGDGVVTIVNASSVVTFNVGSVTGCMGDLVTVPMTVEGFDCIEAAQFSLAYDSDDLEFVEIIIPTDGLPGLNSGTFNGPPSLPEGQIAMAWTIPGVDCESLDDGAVLFEVVFRLIGADGSSSSITIGDVPLPKEIGGDGGTLPANCNPGSVSIDCSSGCTLDMLENIECDGDDLGSIFISVNGGSGNFTYLWSNGSTDEDLIGVPAGMYSVVVTDTDNGSTSNCGPYEIVEEFGISDDTEVTGVACGTTGTGAIDLVICGVADNIEWTMDGNFFSVQEDLTALDEGVYVVIITDAAGVQFTETYTVAESSDITLDNTVIMNETSAGSDGSIDITVSGSATPFTYLWSNGATTEDIANLPAACYSVTITDADDCMVVFDDICVTSDGLQVDVQVSGNGEFAISCDGEADGSITLTPQNGMAPYTYEWSNPAFNGMSSIDSLREGAYTVTVTDDNGLTFMRTIMIIAPDPIDIIIERECASSDTEADGVFVAAPEGGVGPYSYVWNADPSETSNRLSGIMAGETASVVVTDANGCVEALGQEDFPAMCIDGGECFTGREVITPNGDNLNDELRIACLPSNNRLEIFNRVGERVWRADNYRNDWRGTSQAGDDLEDGTYYWVMTVITDDNREVFYRGHVTLLRRLN